METWSASRSSTCPRRPTRCCAAGPPAAHQSLQEYLLAKLVEEAAHPTLGEVFDEIEAEFEQEGGGGTFTLQEVVDIIREDRESH